MLMAYIRSKYKKRNDKKYGPYYYLVKSYREGDKVRQKVLKYLGKDPTFKNIPDEYKDDVRGHPVFVERGISNKNGREVREMEKNI